GLKSVRQLLDGEPFIPLDVLELAQWTAEYYSAGPGEMIAAVLPPKARGARADAHRTVRVAAITAVGMEALAGRVPLTPRQREALELLAGTAVGLPTLVLAARGIGADVIGRLARKKLAGLRLDRLERDPFSTVAPAQAPDDPDRRLTEEQVS